MNKLLYSPDALSDLDEIWTYIANDLQNPTAAQNTVNSILDIVERLQELPEMEPSLSSVTAVESDYRFLVCGNYLAFYRVRDETVSIDRILYGRRDY